MAASSSSSNDQPEEDASELIFPKGSIVFITYNWFLYILSQTVYYLFYEERVEMSNLPTPK